MDDRGREARIRIFPKTATPDAKRLVIAKGLRAIADGYVSILLPAYLIALGFSPFQVGAIATATLLGSAVLTLFTSAITSRFGYRTPLVAASILMAMTGLGFMNIEAYWPLLLIAFVGTLNPSAGDVSIFMPLEQALLAHAVDDRDRTALFARYSLAGSLMVAFGSLLAALPDLFVRLTGIGQVRAIQIMFLVYAVIGVGAGAIYRHVAEPIVAPSTEDTRSLGPSRALVYRLTALFSIDAFGGGFFVQSILALWMLKAFDLAVSSTAAIFFWTNVLTAASYLAAAPIANRIGLVRTMVFTHLPSNLCLIAIPFIPNLPVVIGLLMLRATLSQMDVPARTSYVMAVVTPAERPAAVALTVVPRTLMAAISPLISGYLLTISSFAWPPLIGGVLKITYDLLLLRMFRHIRPAEETGAADASK